MADTALGLRPGDRVELGGLELEVVGLADQVTWYFGTPTVFVAIQDAQGLGFDGQPLAMAIITHGVPSSAPSGLQMLSDSQAQADLERPLASGTQSLGVHQRPAVAGRGRHHRLDRVPVGAGATA